MLASDSMLRVIGLGIGGLALAALAVACGDGPDPVVTRTATTAAVATATVPPAQTIPAPTIPEGNIEAIKPVHGAKIPQAATRNTVPDDPTNGVCVQVNFDGMPEQMQWVRMIVDEEEVTVSPDILLFYPTDAQETEPEGGTMCYLPPDGLSVGVHTVTVGIQNPRNPQEPNRQIVQWQFQVTP